MVFNARTNKHVITLRDNSNCVCEPIMSSETVFKVKLNGCLKELHVDNSSF